MDTAKLKVMLVDDSPFDRGMARRELSNEFDELSLLEVTNQIEFDAAINGQEFDLVITDFQIRWTDGLKVLDAVKLRWPDCPVLMFTATGSEEIAVQAMKSGLDDYVIKNAHHFVRLRVAARSALEHTRNRIRADRLEKRLSTLLENIQVGVFRRDSNGVICEANSAAALILGHDLVGRRIRDFLRSPSDPMLEGLGDGAPWVNHELSLIRKDGEVVQISVTEHESTDSRGKSCFDGIMEDVTDRRRNEDELRRVYDQMAHLARLNTMTEMAAGISHELNQPLSAISNYASAVGIALANHSADENLNDDVKQIQALAFQCGKIIRGLRDFTQRNPLRPEKASVAELIHKTVQMLQFEIRVAEVDLEIVIPDTEIIFEAEFVQIQQVLVNLVSNAIDAIGANENSTRRLIISATTEMDRVIVQVTDSGKGISAIVMDRLFEPYVSDKPEGTGIGLSISSRIITAHRGELNATNNDLGGATFLFSLPFEKG